MGLWTSNVGLYLPWEREVRPGVGMGPAGMSLSVSVVHLVPRSTVRPRPRGQGAQVAEGQISKNASGQQVDVKYFGLVLNAIKFLAHTICFQLRNNGLAKHQPLMAGIKG